MQYYEGIIKNTEFFTTSELADKLKMNAQVITRKIQSGEIRAYKIGKDWRIPEQSVFDWLETNVNDTKKAKEEKFELKKNPVNRLQNIPLTQEGNRKHLLEYILAQFDPEKEYSEREVNRIITRFHHDTESVRNEIINERMMEISNGHFRRCVGYKLS